MHQLNRADLDSLENYATKRADVRARVIAHKKNRTLAIGPHATLLFEDRLTIQYQIQEMIRVERLYLPEEIQGELDAYNPLIPDGNNWKATLLIEIPDVEERRKSLAQWKHIEDRVWVKVKNNEPVYAIADEDMPRENAEKTSAVHFLRFTLTPEMIAALKSGEIFSIGIDHLDYQHTLHSISEEIRLSLLADLD